MRRLFKKSGSPPQKADSGGAVGWVYKIIAKVQHQFVVFMSKQSTAISVNVLRWLVALFFLGGISLSAYYISEAFAQRGHTPIYISHLHALPPANSRLKSNNVTFTIISEDAYQRVVQLHSYMDSLRKYEWHLYDSFYSSRPGLMDSMALLEHIYNQQKNTKHE